MDKLIGWQFRETVAMSVINPTSVVVISKGQASQEEFDLLCKLIVDEWNEMYPDDLCMFGGWDRTSHTNMDIYLPVNFWNMSKYNGKLLNKFVVQDLIN